MFTNNYQDDLKKIFTVSLLQYLQRPGVTLKIEM